MLWQPRLSKPKAQTNSYLFRAVSKTDLIEVIWLIPSREMWHMYDPGKVTENIDIAWSISEFEHNRQELEKPHPEDLPEERARLILKDIVDEKLQEVRRKKNKAEKVTEIVDKVQLFFNE